MLFSFIKEIQIPYQKKTPLNETIVAEENIEILNLKVLWHNLCSLGTSFFMVFKEKKFKEKKKKEEKCSSLKKNVFKIMMEYVTLAKSNTNELSHRFSSLPRKKAIDLFFNSVEIQYFTLWN